jgi:hypothetical protein
LATRDERPEEFVRLDEALDGLLGMLAEPFVLIAKWFIGKIGR